MPIGYMVTALALAVCVALAAAPARPRRSRPESLRFRLSFLVNELPFLAFYWLVAATALAFADGEVHGVWVGLTIGIAAATTVGLAVVAWRGARASEALVRALDESLGPDWRSDSGHGTGTRRRVHRPWGRILAWPFPWFALDVQRIADLSYGPAGRFHRLDVYRWRSTPPTGPILVHLHGGTFRHGAKSREARPLFQHLARQGWVCISANYRLGPDTCFPENLIDVKRVVAWAHENGPRYGADASTIVIAGSSAGGHLASVAALTQNDPRFQPGFEASDTSIGAAVLLYPYLGSAPAPPDVPASPGAYLRRDAPPFLVVHGDHDTCVIREDVEAFVARLRSIADSPVVYAELPGAQHVFDLFHSPRFEAVVDAVEAFTTWVGCHSEWR